MPSGPTKRSFGGLLVWPAVALLPRQPACRLSLEVEGKSLRAIVAAAAGAPRLPRRGISLASKFLHCFVRPLDRAGQYASEIAEPAVACRDVCWLHSHSICAWTERWFTLRPLHYGKVPRRSGQHKRAVVAGVLLSEAFWAQETDSREAFCMFATFLTRQHGELYLT